MDEQSEPLSLKAGISNVTESALRAGGFKLADKNEPVGRFVERIEDATLDHPSALPTPVYAKARELRSAMNGIELVLLFAGVQMHSSVLVCEAKQSVAVLSVSVLGDSDPVHCAAVICL